MRSLGGRQTKPHYEAVAGVSEDVAQLLLGKLTVFAILSSEAESVGSHADKGRVRCVSQGAPSGNEDKALG